MAFGTEWLILAKPTLEEEDKRQIHMKRLCTTRNAQLWTIAKTLSTEDSGGWLTMLREDIQQPGGSLARISCSQRRGGLGSTRRGWSKITLEVVSVPFQALTR